MIYSAKTHQQHHRSMGVRASPEVSGHSGCLPSFILLSSLPYKLGLKHTASKMANKRVHPRRCFYETFPNTLLSLIALNPCGLHEYLPLNMHNQGPMQT